MEQPERQFRELFQELKQEDARHTPPFTRVWTAATARGANRAGYWLAWRVAAAALALLLCVGGWLAFFRRSPETQIALPVVTPSVPPVAPAPPREQPQMLALSNDKPVIRTRARRQKATPPLPLETLVSQWHSPTDFLLSNPGERWLREVPRIGTPRLDLKPFVNEPKQQNELEGL